MTGMYRTPSIFDRDYSTACAEGRHLMTQGTLAGSVFCVLCGEVLRPPVDLNDLVARIEALEKQVRFLEEATGADCVSR